MHYLCIIEINNKQTKGEKTMRFIEIISRSKRGEMMSYDKLNSWLGKKARHAVIVCYYRNKESKTKRYEFIGGENIVPQTYNGMELVKVVL